MEFPARLAAIDIGSNAIRFVAADFKNPHRYKVVEQLRLSVRLGRSVFDTGRLSTEVLDAVVAALQTITDVANNLRIDAYRAVATSAARDSTNGEELIRRAREESGLAVEIIDGDEEARLVYIAARNRVDLDDKLWLMVDIGGGSMEVASVDARTMHHVESHPVGALRFAAHASANSDDIASIRSKIDLFMHGMDASPAFKSALHGMIATGGSIDALARIAGIRANKKGLLVLDRESLASTIETLSNMDYEERSRAFKIPHDRADVILPSAILYERLAARAGVDRIVAPQVGVKEGVLLDLAAVDGQAS